MNAARTKEVRQIQFHATNLSFDGAASLRRAIVRYVCGTPCKPKKPMSLRQIQKYFRSTTKEFVSAQLDEAVQDGDICIMRNGFSQRAGYVYGPAVGGWTCSQPKMT